MCEIFFNLIEHSRITLPTHQVTFLANVISSVTIVLSIVIRLSTLSAAKLVLYLAQCATSIFKSCLKNTLRFSVPWDAFHHMCPALYPES